jgi:hypothetical protein
MDLLADPVQCGRIYTDLNPANKPACKPLYLREKLTQDGSVGNLDDAIPARCEPACLREWRSGELTDQVAPDDSDGGRSGAVDQSTEDFGTQALSARWFFGRTSHDVSNSSGQRHRNPHSPACGTRIWPNSGADGLKMRHPADDRGAFDRAAAENHFSENLHFRGPYAMNICGVICRGSTLSSIRAGTPAFRARSKAAGKSSVRSTHSP